MKTPRWFVPVVVAAFVIGFLWPVTQPPVPHAGQGEANVRREMPRAQRTFGARDRKAWGRFWEMSHRFEQTGGFENEAQQAAAYRVLSNNTTK